MTENADNGFGLLRNEKKYVISGADKDILVERLSRILDTDSHAGADGIYTVRSIYFDSSKAQDDNGAKYRIRFYSGNDTVLHLEKKLRTASGSQKEHCPVTKAECESIISGDIGFLANDSRRLLRDFALSCEQRKLKPASIVEYSRHAFVYPPADVRITVDFDIRSCPASAGFFSPQLPSLAVYHDGSCLVEVKYSGFLPDFIREIIDLADKRDTGLSKYLQSRNPY